MHAMLRVAVLHNGVCAPEQCLQAWFESEPEAPVLPSTKAVISQETEMHAGSTPQSRQKPHPGQG